MLHVAVRTDHSVEIFKPKHRFGLKISTEWSVQTAKDNAVNVVALLMTWTYFERPSSKMVGTMQSPHR